MAKSRSLDEDKQILKKKVQERRAASENPEGDEAIRALHKRLKRAQRKLKQSQKERAATPNKKCQSRGLAG